MAARGVGYLVSLILDDRGRIGAAVHIVAEIDQPVFGGAPIRIGRDRRQQLGQQVGAAVDVANRIDAQALR